MMDNLRAASNHVVLKVILGLIILSFVLTGVGNYLIGGGSDFQRPLFQIRLFRRKIFHHKPE